MRGSVAFVAVFAVASCSVGVSGVHLKSGVAGPGTGDGPGEGESALGGGGNNGHRIGKRSNFGHDIAKQASVRSAAARRQQMTDTFQIPVQSPQIVKPVVLPQFPPYLQPPEIAEDPQPCLTAPIFVPPISTKPWDNLPLAKSDDPPFGRAGASEREVRPLYTSKSLPLPGMREETITILPNAFPNGYILPPVLMPPPAERPLARSQSFYRSGLKNRRHSGSRSHSPLRSIQTLPGPIPEDVVVRPLYKNAGNTAAARRGAEEYFRSEYRSAVIKYLIQLWNKIAKWFKPDGGTGGLPPKGVGKEAGPSLPVEPVVHTEPPAQDYDDVIIEPVTPPVDNGVEIIHLLTEDAPETAGDSTAGAKGDGGDDYYEMITSRPQHQTNWEARQGMGDDFLGIEDDTDIPSWYAQNILTNSMHYSNWEARRSMGKEDGASAIEDTPAGTRSKNMADDSDTLTDIFGRRADD